MRSNVSRAIKALRARRRWRQTDLGRRAGLSRDVVHRAEDGQLQGVTVGTLDRLAGALDAVLVVEVRWRGADLDRLIDHAHAALQSAAATRLEAAGWVNKAEVSFNYYGDRGRCDLLAWHPATRSLLVVEVKSDLGNLQETLGSLDVKTRLGINLAEQLGWGRPARVIPALVLGEGGTNRRVIRRHEVLFRSFGVRGRAALAWVRAPGDASGILWFESPDSDHSRTR